MTEFQTPIQAGSSVVYATDLVSNGSPVLAAQISSILLTIVDGQENIVDTVEDLEVKDLNGGTLTDGHFQLVLSGDRTDAIPEDPSQMQIRYLHFQYVFIGGNKLVHEVLWYVQDNHIPGED